MKRTIITIMTAIMAAAGMWAAETDDGRHLIMRKDSVQTGSRPHEMVIVRGDTVSTILPEKNYGRYDRGLFNYLYVPRGSWAFGLTASYGNLDTENVQVLSVLDNVNFKGKTYSIKPSVAYFFKNNQSVGLRVDYTSGKASLQSLALDFGDDMSFNIKDVSYEQHGYKVGLFYRNYVGLNSGKRFAVFNEAGLNFSTGGARFKRYYADVLYNTHTRTTGAELNFSPGVCLFIQDNMAFNVSFGVFGLHFSEEKQSTNGTDEGSRYSSGANFRFNIFNINFGLLVVI